MSDNKEEKGYVFISETNYGDTKEEYHEIRVPSFEHVHPARVKIAGSVTKNMGNYNSARIEVSIDMPCLPVASEVARVATLVESWVDEIVGDKINRIELGE